MDELGWNLEVGIRNQTVSERTIWGLQLKLSPKRRFERLELKLSARGSSEGLELKLSSKRRFEGLELKLSARRFEASTVVSLLPGMW